MKGEIEETFTNSEDCVKATAIDICEQYTFAPFMAVLSLCNVIESPIYLFTRLLSDKRLMSLFNNKIEPEETTGRPFYLFWMNLSSDNSRLDHFVPLLCEDLFTYQTTTRTNTKTETDVFDTATMSSIFTAIGNKRKEAIFPEHPFMKRAKIINNIDNKHDRKKASLPLVPRIPLYKTAHETSTTSKVNSKSNASKLKTLHSYFTEKKDLNTISSIPTPIASCSHVLDRQKENNSKTEAISLSPNEAIPKPSERRVESASNSISEQVSTNNINSLSDKSSRFIPKNDIHHYAGKALNIEDKIYAMENAWKPYQSYNFPKNAKGKRFQHNWLTDYNWLLYSPAVEGAYCKMCALFGNATGERNSVAGQLIAKPYFNWNNAKANFNRHETKSPVHALAKVRYVSFRKINIDKKSEAINLQMDNATRQQVESNRNKLKIIIKVVLFCAR